MFPVLLKAGFSGAVAATQNHRIPEDFITHRTGEEMSSEFQVEYPIM
jgi:hypothetical protein